MKENDIQKLVRILINKKYTYKSWDGTYDEANLISSDAKTILEEILRQFLLDNHDEKIGVLEAKVYAYEKIIANSNFAPILKNKTNELEEG